MRFAVQLDAGVPDTGRREKEAYFKRLRTEPVFLLQNVWPLTKAVLRRLRTRVTLFWSPAHRGTKTQPTWLAPSPWVSAPPPARALTLPRYPSAPANSASTATHASAVLSDSGDPEDYLAAHRWTFLVDALLTGGPNPQAQLASCLRWLEAHPDKSEAAWEPYSASERVANLLVYLAATQRPGDAAIPRELVAFVWDSLRWIRAHLEYYGLYRTNNHILNNARAIVMAAAALEDSAALTDGLQILRQCLPKLITAGGFLRERSTHYQFVVLNWLLDARHFACGRAGVHDSFLVEQLQRMLAASTMLRVPGAQLPPLIGDVSPDMTPAQSLGRLARLYPDCWPPAQRQPCEATAATLIDGWFRVVAGRSVVLGNFPAGAYPAAFPTHGHADVSSFVWMRDGREILVDRGRYRYTPDLISDFQRRASGHNLPLVDGFAPVCESLLSQGTWCPLPFGTANLEARIEGDAVILAHDGFARATSVRHHSRTLSLADETLIVVDSFEGSGEADLDFCWHFAETFSHFDATSMQAIGSDARLAMTIEGLSGLPRVACADESQGGWISRTYGERHPALGVCLRWRASLPTQVTTRLSLRTS